MSEGSPHEYKEQLGACVECGNSPVNHLETYLTQSLAVWSSGERSGAWRKRFDAWSDALTARLDQIVYKSFAALPLARFVHDPARAKTYRSQVVWEEAQRRGIAMEQMMLAGKHTDIYRARINDTWKYFHSLPIPAHFEFPSYGWIDDKHMLKRVLRGAGIPVPTTRSVTSFRGALRALAEIGAPVVVKPRAGSRARHTSVNVTSEDDLAQAFQSAQRLCRYVSIEAYLAGSVCRGTVVHGTLRGFFQGTAPCVVGDGVASITLLIERQNAGKPDRVQDIVLTAEHERFLARSSSTPASVPTAGAVVALTHRTGRLFGGRTRELLGAEHPKLRAYLERAAATVGAPIVGFDLIIPDPEADPDTQAWGIIEANSLPYIDLHYLPLEGKPSNVAAAVWDLWHTTE